MPFILLERQAILLDAEADALYAGLATAYPGATATVSNEVTGGSPPYARRSLSGLWSAPDANGMIVAEVDFDVPGVQLAYLFLATGLTGNNQIGSDPISVPPYGAQAEHHAKIIIRFPG